MPTINPTLATGLIVRGKSAYYSDTSVKFDLEGGVGYPLRDSREVRLFIYQTRTPIHHK
jgi:hypothetical protein